MELLLEVRLPARAPHPRLEVRVELEPEAPVSELVAALHAHVEACGLVPLPAPDALVAVRERSGEALAADDRASARRPG